MDQMLKQRLIGAIVIIALAVIFIPMILEGPDDELSPRTQDMPPPPTIDYQTEVELEVPEESTEPAESLADTTTEQEVSAVTEPPMSQPEAVTIEAEVPAKPAEPVVAKPTSPGIPSRTATASTPGGWILQVGSFSQQDNALSLRDRLKKSGYQASVKDVKGAGGTIHRVLVGPVNDRTAAERLRDKLASEQKLAAMVLENK
ncbi:MAG: SPOR domain-containing protein [Gammaproteobacteria bacterium]